MRRLPVIHRPAICQRISRFTVLWAWSERWQPITASSKNWILWSRLNMRLCRKLYKCSIWSHLYVHISKGKQLAERHQIISETQQHKEILFHTRAHKHTEYAHSHRAALSVFIFVPIERWRIPSVILPISLLTYNRPHNMRRYYIKERGLTGEGRYIHWHGDMQLHFKVQ